MYDKFTDRSKKIMALARNEAERCKHDHIGTEHILIGLIKEGSGVAANVLKNLDVGLKEARGEFEKLVKDRPVFEQTGELPLSSQAKQVIGYAGKEASNINHNYVGTEHLLLALLRQRDGIAAKIIVNLGLKLEHIRGEILNLLGVDEENSPSAKAEKVEEIDAPALILLLDPGSATAEEIGELFLELSTLYRMLGGSGITFKTIDTREAVCA